jgi:cAMP-dependent protein kinase regulator
VQEGDEKSGSESDEDDYFDELPAKLEAKIKNKVARQSVSAEAYGKFNQKVEFKPRVVEKTEEQKAKIEKRLLSSFMFSSLDSKEKKIVIDAMEEKSFTRGDTVILQGESGDELYVVESGHLDCYKRLPNQPQEKLLKTYNPGESFGELALLYNAPR